MKRKREKIEIQTTGKLKELRKRSSEFEILESGLEWAERELRESEEEYRGLAESSTDVFFAMDEELRYTYWNKASEELTGISVKDALGKHLYDIFPQDRETRTAEEMYLKVLRTKQPKHFVNQYQLGGKDLFFEINAYPAKDGLSVFVRDITERKRAEEALRDAGERHRAIVEQAAESIVLVDVETGTLVEFNDRAYQNLGYSREEFGKLKIPDFEVIESDEEVTKRIEKIVKEGCDFFETKHRTKDGEIRDIQISSRAIRVDGRSFVQSIWHDITERKLAEERERQLQQELNLSSRLASVGQMAAGIAHELNNPLTGVIGFADLLLKKDIPENIRKDVDIIYEAAQRVASIMTCPPKRNPVSC